jgi:glycine cleavage system aminomethyltransferase T
MLIAVDISSTVLASTPLCAENRDPGCRVNLRVMSDALYSGSNQFIAKGCNRQMSTVPMILSRRLRPSPYEQRVLENGASAFTLYNKMTLPLVYDSYETEYEHLCQHVQIWDVACERQVEIVGPDALKLVELITPRDMSKCAVGQCKYAPLCDENGGIINDPIILRLAQDRFWLSIADSDVNLWVKGIAYGRGFDVKVFEPDVSPLAIQGPKADDLMADVVGEHTRNIKFFWFIDATIAGAPVKIARSGWSGQGGFEVYLQDGSKGTALWDVFWEAGQKYRLKAGAPNLIERIETGLKSYGQDMTIDSNPFEAALEKYMDLDKPAEYMSRDALARIAETGPARRLVNLVIDGSQLEPMRADWAALNTDGQKIGLVTSRAWSPRFKSNIAFAIVDSSYADIGTKLSVDADGDVRKATVCDAQWRSITA